MTLHAPSCVLCSRSLGSQNCYCRLPCCHGCPRRVQGPQHGSNCHRHCRQAALAGAGWVSYIVVRPCARRCPSQSSVESLRLLAAACCISTSSADQAAKQFSQRQGLVRGLALPCLPENVEKALTSPLVLLLVSLLMGTGRLSANCWPPTAEAERSLCMNASAFMLQARFDSCLPVLAICSHPVLCPLGL